MNAFYKKPIGLLLLVSLITSALIADDSATKGPVHRSLGAGGCRKKVVCADKVVTDNLCVKEDAQINGNLNVNNTITADTVDANTVIVNDILDLSNAVVIEPQNPVLGWWASATKANDPDSWFMHIDQNPDKSLLITMYGGTPLTPREMPGGKNQIGAFFIVNPIPSTQISPTEIIFGEPIPFPLWISEDNGNTFKIQDDNPDIAYLAESDMPDGKQPNEFYLVSKFYRLAQAPEIIPFNSAPFDDYTNPISIYNNTFEALMYAVSNQNAVDLHASDYPGFAHINAIKDKIRDEGIETISTVSTVWPTLKATDAATTLGNNPITAYATTQLGNNPLTTTAGSPNVIVNHTGHGFATGHRVMLSGAQEVGGIVPEQINTYAARQGLAITVLNANQYRIRALGAADFAANGGGDQIRVHSFSVKVHQPAHGFVSGTAISVSGSTNVFDIPASDINTNQLVTRIDADNYLIPVLFESFASGVGGGASVQVARITIPFAPIRSVIRPLFTTTLLTNEWHNAMRGAKIEIDGFEGEYALLNGNWRLSLVERGRDNRDSKPGVNKPYTPDHVDPNTIQYFFNIDLDSSHLPVYDASIHGSARVKVKYGPVRADSEYFETVGACSAVTNAFAFGTHTGLLSFINPYTEKELNTWEQVAELVKGGAPTLSNVSTRGFKPSFNFYPGLDRARIAAPIAFFNNLPANAITGSSIDQTQRIDRTNPIYNHDITRENYLDPERTFNIYYRINPNGPTNPSPLNLSNFLVDFLGYNANGTEFEFTISPYGITPSGVVIPEGAPLEFDPEGWYPIDDNINLHIGGIVKDELSSGQTIAYIRSLNTIGSDTNLFMLFTDFTPKGDLLTDNITHLSNDIRKWVPLLTELMGNEPDKLIIDIRNNSGGFEYHQFALASFIGGNRVGTTNIYSPATNGNQPTESLQDLEGTIQTVYGNTSVIANILGSIRADDTATDYPAAMFRGEGKKLVFLDSINAFSGGDAFPHFFRGAPDNPQELGAGVTSILVGNIDGRLQGGSGPSYSAPLTTTNNLLVLPSIFGNTNPIAGIQVTGEVFSGRGTVGSAPWVNQLPETAMDILLDQWVAETVWQDVGAQPLSPGRLVAPWTSMPNGGQPSLNDNTSWRDRWMEEAINA